MQSIILMASWLRERHDAKSNHIKSNLRLIEHLWHRHRGVYKWRRNENKANSNFTRKTKNGLEMLPTFFLLKPCFISWWHEGLVCFKGSCALRKGREGYSNMARWDIKKQGKHSCTAF